MIIATAGHVDHGKTALVHALTGVDTDRLAEEKRRGMTIDLGFAYQTLPTGEMLGFVDVPGHQRFVHTMLAGVAGVDFVLLVVAADDGPMPQTTEHLAIINLLGFTQGACVITKCDKVSDARVDDVRNEVTEMLAQTGLTRAPVFPVATLEGKGIADVQAYLADRAVHYQRESNEGSFRFAIDRAFSVVGSGLVVTGTVVSGCVNVGDRLALAPGGHAVRVRGLHAQNASRDKGTTGQRLGINIVGADIDVSTVSRGDVLVAADRCQSTRRLDAEISVLSSEPRPFGPRENVHLHIGAADIPAQLQVLGGGQICPGEKGVVHVVLQRPISTVCRDRLILRDRSASRTMGGGLVINPIAPKRRVRAADRLERLRAMAHDDAASALTALLALDEGVVDILEFEQAWNLSDTKMSRLIASADAEVAGSHSARVLIARPHWRRLVAAIPECVAAWHDAHPSSGGVGVAQLHRLVEPHITVEQFRDVLGAAEAAGSVNVLGPLVARPGFQAALPDEDAKNWKNIRLLLRAGNIIPPRVVELAEQLDISPASVFQALTAVARLGYVHPVAANRFYLPSDLRTLADLAQSIGDGFETAAFRDATGLGRNLAIEVLEYFDLCFFTRREGNARTIIGDASVIFPDVEIIDQGAQARMDTPSVDG